MSGTIRRAKALRADLALWDGKTITASRPDATGGTTTGLRIGNEVDVLQVFGGGSARTVSTIRSAKNHIGTSECKLVFAPGTWAIDEDVTIDSNFSVYVPAGCVFSISNGVTLTFLGPVFSDHQQTITSGSGTLRATNAKGDIYQTAAEIAAGVTPSDYAYQSVDVMGDCTRYHSGTVGNSTDDDAAVDEAISVVKQSGGVAVIPPSFNSSMAKPALGLSNNQSGAILDLRTDRPISGNETFGAIDWYVEGRDNDGSYASEMRILGKQNPAWVAVSLSDGTANGYPRTNFASSFLHQHEDQGQWQYLADPLFGGYYSWELIYFAGSTGKVALHATIDTNSKPRFTFAPANLTAASGDITDASNATPIVITTDGAHGLAGVNQPVSISGVVGNTAANGDWEVTVLTSTTFSLNGSEGNGAYSSGGTYSSHKNHSRATVVVPAIQGSTEAIFVEGTVTSGIASGTAPFKSELSKTVDVNLHARPYVVGPTGTQLVNSTAGVGSAKIVAGTVTLAAGTATVNLSGDASFTDNTTYFVIAVSRTGTNAVQVTKTNGGAFTITGTGTDNVDYIAVGY